MCRLGLRGLLLQRTWRLLSNVQKIVKKTYFVALGGMLAALSVTLMFFSALFPIANLVLPGMAGVLLICAVYEMGEGWAFIIFAAVGILSLLLPTSKESAIYYIFFLGHYPIVKSYIERLKAKPLKWAVKLITFNICVAAALIVSVKIFGFTDNMFKYGYVFLALLLNVTFVVYDIALSGVVRLYSTRIRKIMRKY